MIKDQSFNDEEVKNLKTFPFSQNPYSNDEVGNREDNLLSEDHLHTSMISDSSHENGAKAIVSEHSSLNQPLDPHIHPEKSIIILNTKVKNLKKRLHKINFYLGEIRDFYF